MSRGRILVVEDDELVRAILVDHLREAGYFVEETGDGDCAIDQLDDPDDFDLLLTDVELSSALDGIGVVAHARKLDADIAAIVVSTYRADVTNYLKSLVPPAVFLGKPYRLGTVLDAVRNLTK